MNVTRGQLLGTATAVLTVWLGTSAVFGETGALYWLKRQRERDRVGADTMRLARETHELEQAIARLTSGSGLEAIAREQLGLVRPDEVVYRFRPAPSVVAR